MKNNICDLVSSAFPSFGINKIRELSRLIFEISKREKVSREDILSTLKNFSSYEKIKNMLLARRYPKNFAKMPLNSFYLPKYEPSDFLKADTKPSSFLPKNIFYIKDAVNSHLFSNIKKLFPDANFTEIENLKTYLKNKKFSVEDYNKRTENLFIVNEKYDFFKKCPCTSGVLNCGYSVMNLGMGCPFECSYCFLQGYQNVAGIILPYNLSDYLTEEKIAVNTKGFFNIKRIGSGEFTDSLVFDDITDFSVQITDFFKKHTDIYFEFKTKSININNLLNCSGKQNIVAAWSVNSKTMKNQNEHKTPSIEDRLNAAKLCALAGFGTAFHFDPIILYEGMENDYKEIIDMIFDIVPHDSIKWISLGTLRMPAALKTVIEQRFPENTILDGELLLGSDYKLRYAVEERIKIYKFMHNAIKEKKSKAITYLCMENIDIWKQSGIL